MIVCVGTPPTIAWRAVSKLGRLGNRAEHTFRWHPRMMVLQSVSRVG